MAQKTSTCRKNDSVLLVFPQFLCLEGIRVNRLAHNRPQLPLVHLQTQITVCTQWVFLIVFTKWGFIHFAAKCIQGPEAGKRMRVDGLNLSRSQRDPPEGLLVPTCPRAHSRLGLPFLVGITGKPGGWPRAESPLAPDQCGSPQKASASASFRGLGHAQWGRESPHDRKWCWLGLHCPPYVLGACVGSSFLSLLRGVRVYF